MTTSPTSHGADPGARAEFALRLGRFIDASPSPYHACANVAARLRAAGFTEVGERTTWGSDTPRLGFAVRGGSIAAWALPEGASAEDLAARGFRVVGAHTDSPNLRVKPRPDTGRAGFRQLGVEVYGGVLLNSWLDRDLGLSGRAFVERDGALEQHLFLAPRPLARVPQLAIHLDREINVDGLKLDRQQHMAPVLQVGDAREGAFVEFLADELGVAASSIKSYDAMLHDLTPSSPLGTDASMLAAPRLDNLCSAFCGLEALLSAAEGGRLEAPVLVTLFDHEEVGSASRGGADGPMLGDVVERLLLAHGGDRATYLRALQSSLCVSADMAHAVHPNYPERHEPDHHVFMNRGPVIKINANQRYATEAETEAVFQAACERADVPFQKWVMRTNMACGSTIGPLTAAQHGSRTVDVGCAQLSMHSARGVCGISDPAWMTEALVECLLGDVSPR